jgi:hypothetical protein
MAWSELRVNLMRGSATGSNKLAAYSVVCAADLQDIMGRSAGYERGMTLEMRPGNVDGDGVVRLSGDDGDATGATTVTLMLVVLDDGAQALEQRVREVVAKATKTRNNTTRFVDRLKLAQVLAGKGAAVLAAFKTGHQGVGTARRDEPGGAGTVFRDARRLMSGVSAFMSTRMRLSWTSKRDSDGAEGQREDGPMCGCFGCCA